MEEFIYTKIVKFNPIPQLNNMIFFFAARKTKISMKQSKREKLKNDFHQYNLFMNDQRCEKLINQKVSHPLFFITDKDYRLLLLNTIILKNMNISKLDRNQREVTYDIESIGGKLKL